MYLHKKKPLTSTSLIKSVLASAILASISIQPALAYEFDKPIEKAFKLGQDDAKYGKINLDMRYRYELADVNGNGKETAHANTIRFRLGYLTPEFHGLQAFAEFEGNVAMQRDYDSDPTPLNKLGTFPNNTNRQVIADPQEAEFNQGWLKYKIFDTEFKGGRQRIIVDDSRFIGNVGWRQMEQTYDSALITSNFFENLTLQAGYIGQVKNILSIDDTIKLPFANASYKIKDLAKVSVYAYWLAYYDTGQTGRSAQTYGFTVAGSPKITKGVKLHYRGEYSYQGDYKNNPAVGGFDLNRYNLMLGATAFNVTAKAAIEELGGNGTNSFQTPMGTNHKFQGWADLFLKTPVNGIRDVNASLSTKVLGTKLAFVYHNFKSSTKSIDYGNEYDFLITKKFGKHYSLLAKYAYYDADENAAGNIYNKDVNEFWLQGNVSF